MKKKFVSYLVLAGAVFGLAIVGSCKDYEYDVLQDQINGLNGNTAADVTTLQNKLQALQNKVDQKLNNPSTTAELSDSLTDVYKLLEQLTGLPAGSSVANLTAELNKINQKLAGASSIADVEDEINDMKFLWSDSLFKAYTAAYKAKQLAEDDSVRIDDIFDKLADVVAAQDTLVGRIELQDSLANLEARYQEADAMLALMLFAVYMEVEELQDSLSNLYLTEKKRITSLYVQGAMNPVFGSFALPMGIRSNILAAYTGNILNETEFPLVKDKDGQVDLGSLVDEKMCINFSELKFISKDQTYKTFKKSTIKTIPAGSITSTADDNAGRIFITVNPNEVDLDDSYAFSFVTSDGKTTPATIGKFVPSTEKLTFGWTRAASATGFYEAPVKIEDANIKALAPTFAVKKDKLVEIAKNVVNGGLNLGDIAYAVYTLAQTKFDANALKVEWTDSLGDHSVTSQYDVAVTALQPLSFNAMTSLAGGTTDYKIPTINPATELSVSLPDDVHLDIDGSALNAKLDTEMGKVLDEVEAAINKSYAGYNTYANQMNEFVGKMNDLAEKLNPYLSLDASALLAPWIIYKGADGSFHPMSNDKDNPTVFKKGKGGITLYTTSLSAELLAPAYKKYVAVIDFTDKQNSDGTWTSQPNNTTSMNTSRAINKEYPEYYNTVLDGERYAIPFNPTKTGRYTIYYSAMDYSGFIAAEKFYVVVEE